MADRQTALRGQPVLGNQHFASREMQMDRQALSQAVLRLQAQYIRSSLTTEIGEFEKSFQEILQTASIFLVMTEKIAHSSSLVIVDGPSVVKTVCHFLASSNTILEFLDFHEKMTGLSSGGDVSVEKQVKEAQTLVMELLNTFLLHQKAEAYPGKECGLIYNEDVKVFGSFILHRFGHADPSDVPDPADDNEDVGKLLQYWHTETLLHPLRHVPGTPWHKFFGNLKSGPLVKPALFRERKPLPFFKAILPTTIRWLRPKIVDNYEKYRELFETHRQMPGPRLPEFIRAAMIRKIQHRHSHYFRGWKKFEEQIIVNFEDMTELPCPEYDFLGLSRLESLNAEIKAPELAGLSLLGDEVEPGPVLLEAEERKYYLKWDDEWL